MSLSTVLSLVLFLALLYFLSVFINNSHILLIIMGATNSTQTSTLLTTSSHGSLQGLTVLDKNNNKPVYTRYTRIPYALPPTGSRRFRRPVPLPADFTFGSPGNYKEFGDICPQPNYSHSSAVLPNPNAAPDEKLVQSEDCLYLNIWIPAGSVPEGGWPVQFYIRKLLLSSFVLMSKTD